MENIFIVILHWKHSILNIYFVALYSDGNNASVFINTLMVPEMRVKSIITDSATFGANLSIEEMMEEFLSLASSDGYDYLNEIHKHWLKVAGGSIRSVSMERKIIRNCTNL